jgi:hypothetical protein
MVGGFLHGRQLFADDDRIEAAWAFAVDRESTLDVEDLYVRERYRRRGLMRLLIDRLDGFANVLGVQLRVWLTHADSAVLGPDRFDLAHAMGFRVEASGVPWAAKVLVKARERPLGLAESPALRGTRVGVSLMSLDSAPAGDRSRKRTILQAGLPSEPDRDEEYDLGREAE